MISKDERNLRRICRDYEQVENYEKAIADEERWELHHRREISEMKSMKQLKDEGMYYNVEPEELIFLTKSEHIILHHKGKHHNEDTKKKMSEANSGENHYLFGKHHSADTKKKMSYSKKREKHPRYRMHWFNNGIENKLAYECPEGYVKGRLTKNQTTSIDNI